MATINLTTRKNNKIQLNGDLLTGDTYPIKDYIKAYANGKWNKDAQGWSVNADKLMTLVNGSNSIGLRIDDNPAPAKAQQGSAETNGWCNKCHSYCWGDCDAR